MKVDPLIVRGLAKTFAHTGKTVWVYRANDGKLAYDAMVEGQRPGRQHRQQDNFWLVGALDFATGTAGEADEEEVIEHEWLAAFLLVLRAIGAFCVAAAVFALLVCVTVIGAHRPTRGRFH